MGERVQFTEGPTPKENHGRVVRLTYHRNTDGTTDVLQSPAPFSYVATCPSERRILQDKYSKPACDAFYAWHLSGEKKDLEVFSRDAHTGWVEFTDKGIVHVIKDIPTSPYGFAIDGIGGAVHVGEGMKAAAIREFAEETVLVDMKKGKLLTPDDDVELLTELIYQHFMHADTLEIELPSYIVDIIKSARLHPAIFTQTVTSEIPKFEGKENLITGRFRSEMDGKIDEMVGILIVHRDGLNMLKPMYIPTDLYHLRIADLECLEDNKDEKPRALKRNFTVLNTPNMRNFLNGNSVEVPVLSPQIQYTDTISSTSHGIKNLGLAFAQTVTRMN